MRKWMLFGVVMLLMMSGTAAAAQNDSLCGQLNEADCALRTASQIAMQEISSAAVEFNMDLVVGEGQNEIALRLDGSGVYAGHDPNSSAETPDEIADTLRAFNGELILNLNLPRELVRGTGIPRDLTLELRLVDGMGYINFDPLRPLINDRAFTGWGGLDIASLIATLLEQDPDLLDQLGGASSNLDPAVQDQINETILTENYVAIKRTDYGLGDIATFEMVFDFAGLMSEPTIADAMRTQLTEQLRQNDPGMSRVEARATTELVMEALESATLVAFEEIDVQKMLIRSIGFEMALDLSNNRALGGQMINLAFSFTYDYENVPTIDAPEEASILPYRQLLLLLVGALQAQT